MYETTIQDEGEHKLTLRHLTLDDYDDIKEIMDRVYHEIGGA